MKNKSSNVPDTQTSTYNHITGSELDKETVLQAIYSRPTVAFDDKHPSELSSNYNTVEKITPIKACYARLECSSKKTNDKAELFHELNLRFFSNKFILLDSHIFDLVSTDFWVERVMESYLRLVGADIFYPWKILIDASDLSEAVDYYSNESENENENENRTVLQAKLFNTSDWNPATDGGLMNSELIKLLSQEDRQAIPTSGTRPIRNLMQGWFGYSKCANNGSPTLPRI